MNSYKELKELLETSKDEKTNQDYKDFFKFTFHLTFTSDLIDTFGKHKVQQWIDQFNNDKDKDTASKIFSKIQYYDSEAVKNFCKLSFIEWQIKQKTEINKTLFIPLGSSGKSGQMIGYLFRTANSIPESKIKNQEAVTRNDISNYDQIVFLDDFTGTGNQFLNNSTVKFVIRNRSWLLTNQKKAAKLSFISLVAMEKAIENIQEKAPVEVISPHVRRRAYASNNYEFIEFNLKYGSGLFRKKDKDLYLGWGDVGETIIFFYNVPNNTLPILWSGAYSKVTKQKWIPLFKRSTVAGLTSQIRGCHREVAREFYSMLISSTLYAEDYIMWIDIIKEIYLKMDRDTFDLQELHKLLTITSNFLIPYDNMLIYNSPLTFLNKIREDLLVIVEDKVKKGCSTKELNILLDMLDIDKYSINQGILMRYEISTIIKKAMQNDHTLISEIINNIEEDHENIYKIQGATLAIRMFSKEELEIISSLTINKIKKVREYSKSHSLKLNLEEILAKLENREVDFTNIDLDKALKHVNYYGKYKILSINTIRSHLGMYL